MSVENDKPVKKKRIHFKIPTYKKVYSAYKYNSTKYHKIFKKIQALAIKYNEKIYHNSARYRVLNLCYVRDKEGKRQSAGDERHIYRNRALQDVLKEIADYLIITYGLLPRGDVLKYLFRRTHLIVYPYEECGQAELLEAIDKPISVRLKVGIMLLRNLQKGLEIEDAVTLVKQEFNLNEKNHPKHSLS